MTNEVHTGPIIAHTPLLHCVVRFWSTSEIMLVDGASNNACNAGKGADGVSVEHCCGGEGYFEKRNPDGEQCTKLRVRLLIEDKDGCRSVGNGKQGPHRLDELELRIVNRRQSECEEQNKVNVANSREDEDDTSSSVHICGALVQVKT